MDSTLLESFVCAFAIACLLCQGLNNIPKYRTFFIFYKISSKFTFGPSSKCGQLMSQPLSQQIFCNLGSYCSFDKSGLVSSATSFPHVQDWRNLVPKLVSYFKSDHIVLNSFFTIYTFSFFLLHLI